MQLQEPLANQQVEKNDLKKRVYSYCGAFLSLLSQWILYFAVVTGTTMSYQFWDEARSVSSFLFCVSMFFYVMIPLVNESQKLKLKHDAWKQSCWPYLITGICFIGSLGSMVSGVSILYHWNNQCPTLLWNYTLGFVIAGWCLGIPLFFYFIFVEIPSIP